MPPEPSLTIRPGAGQWRMLVRRNDSPEAARFRRELGLPTDRAVIMTGHQAEFWHPGILAKYLAADAAAGAIGAAAWLVVDQDRAETTELRYPGREGGAGDGSALTLRTAVVGERGLAGVVDAAPGVRQGLEAVSSALARHAGGPTLARRVAAALGDLMAPLLSQPSPPTVFATGLCGAGLFSELVGRMKADPESCVRAYNAAVARHPTAGIRPLVLDDVQYRYELPLWHLPPGGPRAHVYAEMLDAVPVDRLAPKALFMTGLMRLAGCDLFIHGTGGGGGDEGHEGYDAVTQDWLTHWLSILPEALAPIATVTATVYLPLDTPPPPTAGEVARARWMAHSARHNPGCVGDGEGEERKRALVAAIDAADSADRARLFRGLHEFLEGYRGRHAAELGALDRLAAAAAARAGEPDLRTVRTWPFALYPAGVLGGLRDRIAAEFGS